MSEQDRRSPDKQPEPSPADPPLTTSLEQKVQRVLSPLDQFVRDQAVAGGLLLVCTVVALVAANSPLADDYAALFHTHLGVFLGPWRLEKSLHHWINEGLMALFFFALGLEIKRELLAGELRDLRRSLLVILAAVGGMSAPALIYFAINPGAPQVHGWAIPVATDTAFALGVLALLGGRVPHALTTFLVALAIVDDIGAVMVIALFYTGDLSPPALGAAAALLGGLILMNLAGVRRPLPYFLGGGAVWLAVLHSGLHATVAGVLVAFVVPARPRVGTGWFVDRVRRQLQRFEQKHVPGSPILADEDKHALVEGVQETAQEATTPLQRWERAWQVPVGLLVMPIFALANAGVSLSAETGAAMLASPVTLGVVLGLVVGKPLGVLGMCWLGLRLGLSRLPTGVRFAHLAGVSLLAGIGFTMSLFVGNLGFAEHPDLLVEAKLGVLAGSLLAGTAGTTWLLYLSRRRQADVRAEGAGAGEEGGTPPGSGG